MDTRVQEGMEKLGKRFNALGLKHPEKAENMIGVAMDIFPSFLAPGTVLDPEDHLDRLKALSDEFDKLGVPTEFDDETLKAWMAKA
jgi:hypothetical protein